MIYSIGKLRLSYLPIQTSHFDFVLKCSRTPVFTLTSVFIVAHVEDMSQLMGSCASGTADCPPPILRESNRECFRTHSTGESNPHCVPTQVKPPVDVHSHDDDIIPGFVITSVVLSVWRAWEQSYVHEPPVL